MKSDTTIVFVPETASGHGTGHMRRALALAPRFPRVHFLIDETDGSSHLAAFPALRSHSWGTVLPPGPKVFILDKAMAEEADVAALQKEGPVIGLDTRGPAALHCACVVDTLPRTGAVAGSAQPVGPNVSDRGFLVLPDRQRTESQIRGALEPKRILVTFGGEDHSGQTAALAVSGWIESQFPAAGVTWVRGPLMEGTQIEGWTCLDAPGRLADHLSDYDLVITMMGLTAYEALASGCLVLLWNPTDYHQELAVVDDFASLGVKGRHRLPGDCRGLLDKAVARTLSFRPEKRDIADFIASLPLPGKWVCPACGSGALTALARFPERTFARCADCAMTSMLLLTEQTIEYKPEYFFEAYQAQYGKTYLDDFGHIRAMGKGRIDRIKAIGAPGPRLLDLGCAYGPFLAAARDGGFDAEGGDIAADAVAYCRDQLGFPARVIDLGRVGADELTGGRPFDVITLWYVIEHFPDLGSLLRLISASLAEGGILALSTPSLGGISGRQDPVAFFRNSPMDHYTLWDPRHAGKLLAMHGLEVVRIHGSGHHPERFRGPLGSTMLRPLGRLVSGIFGLADTFELYARKRHGHEAP